MLYYRKYGNTENRVFKWHKLSVSLKAEAVFLYFRGLSLRAVKEYVLNKGYKVSIETTREWFHAVGKALQAIYTVALWAYVYKKGNYEKKQSANKEKGKRTKTTASE